MSLGKRARAGEVGRRALLLGGAAAFLLARPLHAAPVDAAVVDAAAVSAPVQRLNDALLAAMKSAHSRSFAQRFDALAPVIAQSFDLAQILRTSIGPRWVAIPPTEQASLLAEFSHFTVASYVANFNGFDGERFAIMPNLRAIGADQVVASRILLRSGAPAEIDYVLHDGPAGWQIVDVLLDGAISRVAVQRSDFRRTIATGGATALLAQLRQKVASLSGGSVT
jgi:phospholipid transport system substrate-binding protein